MVSTEPCISIPVQESDEVVLVSTSELPSDPEDLLDLLRGEFAPLHLWLDFAKAYLASGQVKEFLHILGVACGEQAQDYFKDSKFERLQIHCALASYQLSKAYMAKESAERAELLNEATGHLNKAVTIDINEQLPVLGLGQVAQAKGEIAQAKQYFQRASSMTCNGMKNISGLLAVADLTFQQAEYRKALSMYRRALKEHPNCPPEVRLGIAACNFKLGSFQRAVAGYQRTLQLDPNCCEALLGLAVLSFNAPDADRGLREGMQMLCKAFTSNPLHPGVLNMLAHFSLLQGDLQRARTLSGTALEAAERDVAKAQSLLILARACHSAGLKEARRYYSQASQLNPKAALPLLGLAQMTLTEGDNTNAITLLENALQLQPGWNDALMLLGSLYPQMEGRKGQTALEHFKTAAEKNTNSGQVLEILGELLARTDPQGSLTAYKRSIECYKKEKAARQQAKEKAQMRAKAKQSALPNGNASHSGAADAGAVAMDRVSEEAMPSQAANEQAVAAVLEGIDPPEAGGESPEDSFPLAKLLNNAAALHLRAGEKEAALNLMYEAIEAANAPGGSSLAASNQVTLGYNLARAKEAAGNLAQASKEYQDILAEFPEYLDCYFRLAWISRNKGNHADALRWAEKALEVKEKDPNALALIGFLHMEHRDWKEAEDTFKELRSEPANKNDTYACLAQGAIPLNSLSGKRKEPEDKVDKLLDIALKQFTQILARGEESNLFAAHGAAAVLAEQATRANPPKIDYLLPAKRILDKVKDAAASIDPWIQIPDLSENLGHIALAEGRMKDALQLYNHVQRRWHRGTSAELLQLSARALYDEDSRHYTGGETDKVSLLPEARVQLMKAVHLDPSNPQMRFNGATVMQEAAVRILRKPRSEQDASKAAEYQAAVNDLAMAHRTFFYLRNLGKRGNRIGIDDAKLEQHILFCHQTHGKASQLLLQAEKELEALEAKRQQSRIELEAALREKKALEEAEKRRKQRAAAERDEKAKRAEEHLKQLQATWADNKNLAEAVAEGDAMKADKRRKKKMQEMEQAADPIFGGSDESDGGDYIPDNAEEPEYIEAGVDQEDEAEGAEEADGLQESGEGQGRAFRKRILAGTGLESEDEDEEMPEAGKDGEQSPELERRIKRKKIAEPEPSPATGNGNTKNLFDDSDEEEPQAAQAVSATPTNVTSRQRNAQLFGDSDDE